MSPRPQKATDDQILAAMTRVMQRVGPRELTLAAIAAEAGVTAALLVQRFGSKRELMLRLTATSAEMSASMIGELRAAHASPSAALLAYVDCMAELAASPTTYMRALAYLQDDLADPDRHRHLVRQARQVRAELEAILADAVAARELVASVDAPALARGVEATINGSLMSWAFYREGPAARWLRHDVEQLLAPYRPG